MSDELELPIYLRDGYDRALKRLSLAEQIGCGPLALPPFTYSSPEEATSAETWIGCALRASGCTSVESVVREAGGWIVISAPLTKEEVQRDEWKCAGKATWVAIDDLVEEGIFWALFADGTALLLKSSKDRLHVLPLVLKKRASIRRHVACPYRVVQFQS